MHQREVILCNPVRTAIGTFGGSLKSVPATELGATVVRAVLDRSKLDGSKVTGVVLGNVIQAGNKMNPARQSAVHGGIPVDVPAMTVNRVCGSGAQAIVSAAQEIRLGMLDGAVASGVENMAHRFPGAPTGSNQVLAARCRGCQAANLRGRTRVPARDRGRLRHR
jgi:acetyl-CoA C-acetyltransferase